MTPLSHQELIDQELVDTREHEHMSHGYKPSGNGLTHCQRVLKLLSDGEPHSHLELYALGTVAHSRISDLRAKGYRIDQWREGDLYLYKLTDPLSDSAPVSPLSSPGALSPSGLVNQPRNGVTSSPDYGREDRHAGPLTFSEPEPQADIGSTLSVSPPGTGEAASGSELLSRIREKIEEREDGCWYWLGGADSSGYPLLRYQRQRYRVSRLVYSLLVGPIPEGLTLDHLCHTADGSCPGGIQCQHRRCVNPAHLEPVTSRENTLRGLATSAVNARKTECAHGHPFDEENTRHRVGKRNERKCRQCVRDEVRERSRAKRARLKAEYLAQGQSGSELQLFDTRKAVPWA